VKFTGQPGNRMIKTLVYVPLYSVPQPPAEALGDKDSREEGEMVVILLRGDHM